MCKLEILSIWHGCAAAAPGALFSLRAGANAYFRIRSAREAFSALSPLNVKVYCKD